MNASRATLIMVALFALRCLVPILLTIGIGYLMNWYVSRWETAAPAAASELGLVLTAKERAVAAAIRAGDALPCWVRRDCAEEQRATCPAYMRTDAPCWAIRAAADGRRPMACAGCPMLVTVPVRR